MASYPGSLKVFTTKTDDTDVIFAAHVNDLQDEVAAVQSTLGTNPQGAYATVKAWLTALEAADVTDHGALSGLADDDHSQYLNNTRHDTTARHGSTVVDHGQIGGLGDDDHSQYLNNARHDTTARHGSGVVDHGSIGGLGDDDHTIYQRYGIAEFAKEGDLAVAVGKGRYRWPFAVIIEDISVAVNTPPAGSSAIIDVDRATAASPTSWSTIYSTQGNRPTVAIGNYASTPTTPDITSFAAGDFMRVDIDQVGSTTPGADLSVFVRYRRA